MAAENSSLPEMSSGPSVEFLNYIDTTEALSVTVRQPEQEVLVIHVAGELDMLTGPPLKEHLNRLLDTRPERLIVDLSEVVFLGSFGLAVLLGARHAAAKQDTTFQLSGTSHRAVARPLQITGLDQLFEMRPPGELDNPPA
ncbi:MAG: STAS domain-containing protein [Pseudonocardiaceae bacterium]